MYAFAAAKVHFRLTEILTFDLEKETFPIIRTHILNICGKFHWNPFTKYGDRASRE